jgi:hypothetical protein
MQPVQRFHWGDAAYAEAFATLVRCAGERVEERQILRELFAAYPATSHAVDWGAGSGDLTSLMVEHFQHVYAVEPHPGMRAVLATRCPRAQILDGTIMSTVLPTQVEVGLISHVFYHVFPSACHPKTSWPSPIWTLICGLSFCARDAGSIAALVSYAQNGRILLANSEVPKFVYPTCLLGGTNAGEIDARKSTSRTLKEIRQQYPGVFWHYFFGRYCREVKRVSDAIAVQRQMSFQITEKAQRERIGTQGNFQSNGKEKKAITALTVTRIKYHQEERAITKMIVKKGSTSPVLSVIALAQRLSYSPTQATSVSFCDGWNCQR